MGQPKTLTEMNFHVKFKLPRARPTGEAPELKETFPKVVILVL